MWSQTSHLHFRDSNIESILFFCHGTLPATLPLTFSCKLRMQAPHENSASKLCTQTPWISLLYQSHYDRMLLIKYLFLKVRMSLCYNIKAIVIEKQSCNNFMVIGCSQVILPVTLKWFVHLEITRGFLSTISVGLKAMIIVSIVWISVGWIFYFLIFDIERICFGIRFLWAYRWTNTLLVKTKSTYRKRRAYKNTFK